MTSFFSPIFYPIWIKISETGAEWHVDCGTWSKSKPDVEFQYGGRFGEFNGMSSQSHISHCGVLPLGEFTVMIPETHATLQGAVTWRNQCHDRATLHRVRIPFSILKIVFHHILFLLFLMQFRLWRAAAFVSSPIHLFSRAISCHGRSAQNRHNSCSNCWCCCLPQTILSYMWGCYNVHPVQYTISA